MLSVGNVPVRHMCDAVHLAGDVVLAQHPKHGNKLIVKRVLATGGTMLAPPLANHPGTGLHKQAIVDVPPGFVWLGGDNLAMSNDSRDYGPVPQSLLLGKLTAQVQSLQSHEFLPVHDWELYHTD